MRILRSTNQFLTAQKIRFKNRDYEPGQAIDINFEDANEMALMVELFYLGRVIPTLIPETGEFEAVSDFTLRADNGELCEIKCGEILELGREFILDLIRKKFIVPVNPEGCWCPYKKRTQKDIQPWLPSSEEKKPWMTSWGPKKEKKNRHPVPGLKEVNEK